MISSTTTDQKKPILGIWMAGSCRVFIVGRLESYENKYVDTTDRDRHKLNLDQIEISLMINIKIHSNIKTTLFLFLTYFKNHVISGPINPKMAPPV